MLEFKLHSNTINLAWKLGNSLQMTNGNKNSPPTILVIEADDHITSAFRDFSRRDGYIMLAAASVEEAIHLKKKNDIHLVIADVLSEPDMMNELFSGRDEDGPRIPLIIITSAPELIARQNFIQLQPRYILTKPLELEKLRSAVRSSITNHEIEHSPK